MKIVRLAIALFLTVACVIPMTSAQERSVTAVSYTQSDPATSFSGHNLLRKYLPPRKNLKMTPVPKKTSWVCFTPVGTCFVPFLGPCFCCTAFGCGNGHT